MLGCAGPRDVAEEGTAMQLTAAFEDPGQ
jgi:hypothetical protein